MDISMSLRPDYKSPGFRVLYEVKEVEASQVQKILHSTLLT